MLLVSAVGPISAAPSADASSWAQRDRAQTTRHVASAREAAKQAVGSPRNVAAKPQPLRSAKLAAPRAIDPARMPTARSGRSGSTSAAKSGSASLQAVTPGGFQVLQQFAGLNKADGGGFDPPDPWIAVNSSYVVQTVNAVVRISNRAGVEVTSVPTWAFFDLAVGQTAVNTRVIWDATHSRWVASSVSFNAGLTDNYLNLAVSDGANPTAGWRIFSLSFDGALPDYPSLASSSDKIVVTDNLFDAALTPEGADIHTWTWASILAGGSPTHTSCTDPAYFNARAAQVLSPSNDVHLIMEEVPSGEQWYFRVTGTGACGAVVDGTHLSLLAPFAVPPDPRQLTGDTITNAVDERPTDAIWQNGAMWWVSTFPWSYDGGTTFNAVVVLWNVTTSATGAPTNPEGQAVANGDGFDTFMGGIGMSRNGTLFTTYSQSSSTNFPYLLADQVPPGGFLSGPIIQLDYGNASATSERWGGFAGIAMDPVGTGTVWATHMVTAHDGGWRTDVARLVVDNETPTVPGSLTSALVSPTDLLATSTVKLSWGASTDATSGVAKYELAESIDGGAFGAVTPLSPTTTTVTRQLQFNHTYQYRVRAVDTAGNASAYRTGTTIRPTLYQQTSGTVYGGTWGTASSGSYSGGSERYSTIAGRSVTFTATTARSIAFVTTKSASRGVFKVYVDGVYKGLVSSYSPTTKYRQIVYQFTWSTPGTHKIKIVVNGTAGHPRVGIDAFVVLR